MPITPQDEDRIYYLASECEDLFKNRLSQAHSPTITTLLAEYQQRFSTWTAYLGVFARPSQSLDRRLQTLHDIRDIVLRLLGLLKRALLLFEPSDTTATGDSHIKSQDAEEASKSAVESLTEIEETLDRMNRLGVSIRQSARLKVSHRVKLFTQNFNFKDFEYLFTNMVQVLYPNAHPSLRSRLARSMMDRLARILFLKSRKLALTTRRNEQPQQMANIPEDEPVQEADPTQVIPHHPPPPLELQQSLLRTIGPRSSFSDLSSLDTALFRSRLSNLWRPIPKTRKTSSTQIKYDNYPRPPNQSEGEMVVCEWCAQPLSTEDLGPTSWRQHVDRDLEPYLCLSEECAESSAGFSAFKDWSDHMQTHSQRWHQNVYLMPSWVCAVCEDDHYSFGDPENLLSHMQETHLDQFTAEQIRIISRGTKFSKSRSLNECPLCCFQIQDEDLKTKADSHKRVGEPLEGNSNKIIRPSIERSFPKHSENADNFTTDSSSQEPMIMTQHIASHLQALMSLTIRIASRHTDQSVAMEISSDVVDSDDAFSSSRDEDLPSLSILNDDTGVESDPLASPTFTSVQHNSIRRSDDDSPQQAIPPESEDLGKWGDVPRQGEVFADFEMPVLELLTADTRDADTKDADTGDADTEDAGAESETGSDTDTIDESTVDNDVLSNQGIPIQNNHWPHDYDPIFQRNNSLRNSIPRRSLITLMMEQNQRQQSPGNRASQSTSAIPQSHKLSNNPSPGESPSDSDEPPLMMEGRESKHPTPTREIPQSGALPTLGNVSSVQGQAALSPRTTRRNMLATELPESLRRELIRERQQRSANVFFQRNNTSDHAVNDDSCDSPDQPTKQPSGYTQNDFSFGNDEWNTFF